METDEIRGDSRKIYLISALSGAPSRANAFLSRIIAFKCIKFERPHTVKETH